MPAAAKIAASTSPSATFRRRVDVPAGTPPRPRPVANPAATPGGEGSTFRPSSQGQGGQAFLAGSAATPDHDVVGRGPLRNAMTQPGARSAVRSLAEWTATSASSVTTAASTSVVKRPLPPISAKRASGRLPWSLRPSPRSRGLSPQSEARRRRCLFERERGTGAALTITSLLGSGLIIELEKIAQGIDIEVTLLRARDLLGPADGDVQELGDDPAGEVVHGV